MTGPGTVGKVGEQIGKIEGTNSVSATLMKRSMSLSSIKSEAGNVVSKVLSGTDGIKATLERAFSLKISGDTKISDVKVKDLDGVNIGIGKIEPNQTKTEVKNDVKVETKSNENTSVQNNNVKDTGKLESSLKDQLNPTKFDGKNSFKDIMFSPGKSNLYLEFAKKEFNEDNFTFMHEMKAVMENPTLTPEKRMEAFGKINEKYVKTDSPNELNLSKDHNVIPLQKALDNKDYGEALKVMGDIVSHVTFTTSESVDRFRLTPTFNLIEQADKMQAQDNLSKGMKAPDPKGLKGKNELEDFIFNPNKSPIFQTFCKQEFAEENLNFIKDLKNILAEKNPEKLTEKLKELDKKYIGSDSKFDLNVSGANAREFKEAIKSGDFIAIMNSTAKIKGDVKLNLTDTFYRFIHTPAFKNIEQKDIVNTFGPIKNLPPDKKLEVLTKIIDNSDGEIQNLAKKQKAEILLVKEYPMIRLDDKLKPDLKFLSGKDFEKALISPDTKEVMEKFKGADIFAPLCKGLTPTGSINVLNKIIDTSEGEIKSLAILKRDKIRLSEVKSEFNPGGDIGRILFEPKVKVAFEKYANNDFSGENIKAFNDLKKIFDSNSTSDEKEMHNMLQKFGENFIGNKAPNQVNIGGPTELAFNDLISGKISIKSVEGQEVLAKVCSDLKTNMTDTYSRFRFVEKFSTQVESLEIPKVVTPSVGKNSMDQLDSLIRQMKANGLSYDGPAVKAAEDKKAQILELSNQTENLSGINKILYRNNEINQVLNDPKMSEVLKKYTEKEFSQENYNALNDIQKIVGKKTSIENPAEFINQSKEFFDKYLNGESSPQEINIPSKFCNNFKKALDSNSISDVISAFNGINNGLMINISDTYSRLIFDDSHKAITYLNKVDTNSFNNKLPGVAQNKIKNLNTLIENMKESESPGANIAIDFANEKIKELQKYVS